jgi:hypothetical protein
MKTTVSTLLCGFLLLVGCNTPPKQSSPYPQVIIQTAEAINPPDPLSGSNLAKAGVPGLPMDQILTPGLNHISPESVEWSCDPTTGVVSKLYVSTDGQVWSLFGTMTNCEAMIDGSLPFQFYTVSSSNQAGEVFCGSTNLIWNPAILGKSPPKPQP